MCLCGAVDPCLFVCRRLRLPTKKHLHHDSKEESRGPITGASPNHWKQLEVDHEQSLILAAKGPERGLCSGCGFT